MNGAADVAGSFRDPSGFVFRHEGVIYRQVNPLYQEHYDHLMASGLARKLMDQGRLVHHTEVEPAALGREGAYKVVRPEPVPFWSYPYEWCFGQLQAAALATLQIQRQALEHQMTLKDASAYNIQFVRGKPCLIDTLSFERYRPGQPWIAYRQFCQHFLAPLALMAHSDVRLGQLLRIYIDGVPLDLASRLLPARTRFNLPLQLHIHLHARSQQRFAERPAGETARQRGVSPMGLAGLLDNLQAAVRQLRWYKQDTPWGDYYDATNYTAGALEHKKQVVGEMLRRTAPHIVWDLGANTGLYSRLASDQGILTISFDLDPAAVEQNYRASVEKQEAAILPLVLDLTNPSPGLGWQNQERMALLERGPADTVLALALVHHLAISNNLPLRKIAEFLRLAGRHLIVEFVPKGDSQVQRLLASRADIFTEYDQEHFEAAMEQRFSLLAAVPIQGSARTIYLLAAK